MIILFILQTLICDLGVTLKGEIRYQSLFKGQRVQIKKIKKKESQNYEALIAKRTFPVITKGYVER